MAVEDVNIGAKDTEKGLGDGKAAEVTKTEKQTKKGSCFPKLSVVLKCCLVMTISFVVGFTAVYYDPYNTIKLAASQPSFRNPSMAEEEIGVGEKDQDVQRGLRDGEAGQAAGVKNQQKEEQARKWEKYEKFEKKKAIWGP